MRTLMLSLVLSLVATSVLAASLKESALNYVPGGTVVQEKIKEVKIQTPAGGIVEVEFHRDGSFEEASGNSLEKDLLVPGEGLLALKDAIASLKKAGKSPAGEWSLEKSFLKGWHYDFEGFESGAKMEYTVDAKTGSLMSSKVDD